MHSSNENDAVPSVSVILVNYNTSFLLHEVFASLDAALVGVKHNIIVVDNNSKDNSVEVMRRDFPTIQLIENTVNVGFGRANNQALPFVQGDYVLLLNTDAFVRPDSIVKSLKYMQAHPTCGVLGVRLTGRDGELQASARYFPTPWNAFIHRSGLKRLLLWGRLVDDPAWDPNKAIPCDWVPGCFYMIPKKAIDSVGLFDPRYFLYFEEVDHCFAVKKAGWEVMYYPDTTVIHIGGESAKSDGTVTKSGRQLQALQIESELLYFRKNHGVLALIADIFLIGVSDAVNALRVLLGRSKSSSGVFQRTILVFSLLYPTRFATRPTR